MASVDSYHSLLDQEVVLDLSSPYVALGTLVAVDELFLTLVDADLHDLRDSRSTRERYVLDAKEHGIRKNRARVQVAMRELVSLSRLSDVVE